MSGFSLLTVSIFFVLFAIWAIVLVPVKIKPFFGALFVTVVSILTTIPAIAAFSGNQPVYLTNSLPFFGNTLFQLDELSAWFIIVINITCTTGAWFGAAYLSNSPQNPKLLSFHWINYLLFQSSMIWVCLVQNMLLFLVVWELMTFAALMLILFDSRNLKVQNAALRYMVQMHVGVLFLTLGFIIIYLTEGSFDFNAIKNYFSHNPNVVVFILLFAGFAIKAGFVPFHSGVLVADPEAYPHVSGILSGAIVKMGIYGIFRMVTFLHADYLTVGQIVLSVSLATAFFGILNAAVHRDYRRMLTYCTIENIGIIGIGIGLGIIGLGSSNNLLVLFGFGGALLHVLNHSLNKSMLFFTAGLIHQQTNTRNMEKLGGLMKSMPKTAVLFLVGSLAIAGLPPFNGFISEFLIYSGFLAGLNWGFSGAPVTMGIGIALFSLVGGLSILTFAKSFGVIFLGLPRTKLNNKPTELPLRMRLTQYVIIALMLSVAMVPVFFAHQAMDVVSAVFSSSTVFIPAPAAETLDILKSISIFSFVFLVIAGLLLYVRSKTINQFPATVAPTWGCGYISPVSRQQYTGKSFSKALGKLLGYLIWEQKKYQEIERTDVFPVNRKHSSHYTDFVNYRIIGPVTKKLTGTLNVFQFIQNGFLQSYILYGLLFIIVIFICSFFNLI